MKTCSKCGEANLKKEFGKDASKRDGLSSLCKTCANFASAKFRAAHPAYNAAYAAAWAAANPNKIKVASAAWLAANPSKRKAIAADYYAANTDKCRAASSAWLAAHPEARRSYSQNRRARKRENGGKLSRGLAEKLFNLQRGKCACCKQLLGDDFHLDHIMPLVLGGANDDCNIQLLHSTCNQQKYAKHPIDFMQQKGFLL